MCRDEYNENYYGIILIVTGQISCTERGWTDYFNLTIISS